MSWWPLRWGNSSVPTAASVSDQTRMQRTTDSHETGLPSEDGLRRSSTSASTHLASTTNDSMAERGRGGAAWKIDVMHGGGCRRMGRKREAGPMLRSGWGGGWGAAYGAQTPPGPAGTLPCLIPPRSPLRNDPCICRSCRAAGTTALGESSRYGTCPGQPQHQPRQDVASKVGYDH